MFEGKPELNNQESGFEKQKEYKVSEYDLDRGTFTINKDGTLTVTLPEEDLETLRGDIQDNEEKYGDIPDTPKNSIEKLDPHKQELLKLFEDSEEEEFGLEEILDKSSLDNNVTAEELEVYLLSLETEGFIVSSRDAFGISFKKRT